MDDINVLVVDDEQIVIDSIKKHLRKDKKYHIYSSLNVKEALNILDNKSIDIVLTDLMMPEIDGLGLMKIIREKNLNIITIMITGFATINTAIQAQHLGAFDYLAKPFTKEEFIKLMDRAATIVKTKKRKHLEDVPLDRRIVYGFKGVGANTWFMKDDDDLIKIGVERKIIFGIGLIKSIYLPEVGDEVRQGSNFFQIFTEDLRTDSLLSPLTGTVKIVNQYVIDEPNEALRDPYGKGWLVKINPSKFEEELEILGL